jgi:acylphosphatase
MAIKRMRILIEGQLQGLNFRLNAQIEAQKLELVGFVRPLSDGRIEIEAEGDQEQLDKLLAWCQQPPHAERISNILYRQDNELSNVTEFIIRK